MRNATTPFLVLIAVLLSGPARAANVTSPADTGTGSLRNAIASAAAGETINFSGVSAITLTSGELLINKNLIIAGPGASNLVIQRSSGAPNFRIFNIHAGIVTISGLTVSNGRDELEGGGGIYNQADLTLKDCAVTNNFATESGGGIYNKSAMIISNCVVRGNSAAGKTRDGLGGGMYNFGGTATAIASTFSNNSVTTSGTNDSFGGGICNDATLRLISSIINGNSANGGPNKGGGFGGGIDGGFGTSYLTNSTVSGNVARGGAGGGRGEGGGVESSFGTVALDRSTVSGNSAVGGDGGGPGDGGGIANYGGTVYVDNSTVSGNVSSGGAGTAGGGIFNEFGDAELTHSTIASNVVHGGFLKDGGGIFNYGGSVGLKSTIVAANTATVDFFNDTSGGIWSDGFNLIGSTNGPITPMPGDQFNITAAALKLGPLQDNGGPTFTHALLCGSPAINAGDSDNTGAPTTDQRGFARIVGGVMDIGAYEGNNITVSCPEPIILGYVSPDGTLATVSVKVANADGNPLVVVWSVDGTAYQTNAVAAGGPPTTEIIHFTAEFGLGSHEITVSVSDSSECQASCSTTVSVSSGSSAPFTVNCPTIPGVSANGNCQGAVPNIVGSVTSSSSGAIISSQLPPAGTLVGLGTHTITVTATDTAGNRANCTTSFTVSDTRPPSINTCAASQSTTANGSCQAAVPDFKAGLVASDCSGPLGITQNPVAGTLLGPGTHTITLTVNDAVGNSTNCTTSFIVMGQNAAIQIRTLTENTDNDSTAGPRMEAYSTVTWTYLVSNPGCETLENIIVTDSIAGVVPSYQGGDSSLNGRLDPGETWIYNAAGTAVYGQYENVGTATGTAITTHNAVTNSNPDHYFGNATPCPGGRFIYKLDPITGDLTMKFYQSPAPNDNSYGINAVGWASGHSFSSLVGSDKAGFMLRDPSGVIKLDFYLDYVSTKSGTPSGYGSYGPFGGEGKIVVGTLTTNDLTWDTSLARNLNNLGYFVNGVQTAATKTNINGANLLLDSPPTIDKISSYRLKTPNPWTRGWDFCDAYFVTIKKAKLDSLGFNIATWKVEPDLIGLHNSPAKPCLPAAPTASACNVSVNSYKLGSKVVQVTIVNNNKTADAILSALKLTWPSANGQLLSVKLDGDVIYDTPDLAWSSTGVSLGEGGSQPLVSTASKRTIGKGTSDVLNLVFENSVVTDRSKYTGTVSFGSSCNLPILP